MSSASPRDLVLASASPRRLELLRSVGFSPEVLPVDVDESLRPGEGPLPLARRLARAKAQAAVRAAPGRAVLGADTVVVAGDETLGKPTDRDDARRMLRALSGRWHEVVTAIALVTPRGDLVEDHSVTRVRFAELTDDEIERYVDGPEPYDKAGAYAIQGAAAWFIAEIAGSATNVIGLPLERVRSVFAASGLPMPPLGN